MPDLVLGIDLGTSSVKSMCLWTDSGRTKTFAEGYDISYPRQGWAEQDPLVWYEKTIVTLRRLLATRDMKAEDIRAISFSGQMHGLVCLDSNNELLRPAIIWPDQRSAPSIQKIYDTLGASFVASQNQNTIATGFLLASLYWLFEHEQETYGRICHVMLPKDYIKFRLTGCIVTDPSDAAGSTAFDNVTMSWAVKLIEALGMNPDIFPEIQPSEAVIGTITGKASEETGLKQGTPVVNGGADQCMQAVGNGIIGEGIFACNIGTGGQISTTVARPCYDSELRVSTFAHALPKRWNVMGVALYAGASLKWLARQVLGTSDYAALDAEAGKVPPGCEGLVFLPHLGGERVLKDPDARGVFFGLTGKHNGFSMARAVMEGVVFLLKDSLDIIVTEMNIPCKKIVAAGGGAAGTLWPQIQADILEQPLVRNLNTEQACLGAAITAGIGAGIYPGAEQAAAALVRYDAVTFEPRPEYQPLYREYHALFHEIYGRNKDIFKRLSNKEYHNG